MNAFVLRIMCIQGRVHNVHLKTFLSFRYARNIFSTCSILELATRLSDTEKSMRDALADLKAEVRTNAQELISLR